MVNYTNITQNIVLDKRKYTNFKRFFCGTILMLICSLYLNFKTFNRPVEIREVEKVKIVYEESFVYKKEELTADDFKEINCLAMNIYHEARGEMLAGMLMVGLVTKNRVNSIKFPDEYCDVVYQKKGKVAQFSWVNDGLSDETVDQAAWVKSLDISYRIIKADVYDLTDGATFYHKNAKKTKFSDKHYQNIVKIGPIGNHITFKAK